VLEYLPTLVPDGRAVLICPQPAGFASDATHVQHFDRSALESLARSAGLDRVDSGSFPLPSVVGHVFRHNETWLVARYPSSPARRHS
jgi:hypothetical protein